MTNQLEQITVGGGCFWCTEAVFQELKGVHRVEAGYAGGAVDRPTYQQICTGATGHAEVTQISFNPAEVSLEILLDIFWRTHDPTTLNRQGADVGAQYRSVIFYHTEAQRQTAVRMKAALDASGAWPRPLVTEISPLPAFYKAEDYHQNYYRQNSGQPYCQMVIAPKLTKLSRHFGDRLKDDLRAA